MVDFRQRSPLDHLALSARAVAEAEASGHGVILSEIPHRGLINVRGDANDKTFADAFKKATRLTLPTAPNTVNGNPDTNRVMWLGPDEWLVITKPDGGARMFDALWKNLKGGDLHAAVTDSSSARTCIRITGPRAREVMQKGCSIDLHPSKFFTGLSAQTTFAKCAVMMTQCGQSRSGEPTYELFVLRSFATYLWTWLEDAAAEYGMKVG